MFKFISLTSNNFYSSSSYAIKEVERAVFRLLATLIGGISIDTCHIARPFDFYNNPEPAEKPRPNIRSIFINPSV